jgi:hypothetical protein
MILIEPQRPSPPLSAGVWEDSLLGETVLAYNLVYDRLEFRLLWQTGQS